MSQNELGIGIEELTKTLGDSRYFYGLRRTSTGEVYLSKVDLLAVSYTHLTLPTNREV